MQHRVSTAVDRRGSAFLPALVLGALLAAGTPNSSEGASGPAIRDLLQEFNAICERLETARGDLKRGSLDDRAFGDQILELFARADSVTELFRVRFPGPRRTGSTFALDCALRHLRESLRGNYEGIVEKNGLRFVTADAALKAAEAWRSGLADAAPALR